MKAHEAEEVKQAGVRDLLLKSAFRRQVYGETSIVGKLIRRRTSASRA